MLKQKMFQDMKQNKWQFLSIMLMAFLGVFIYTGVGGEWAGIENYRQEYYEQTNLADGWIWGEGFSDSDIQKVKNIDGVTDAEKRFYAQVSGKDDDNPVIHLYGLESNTISTPYIVKGSEFNSDDTGKVWLDSQFADAKGLDVGDSYTFIFDETEFTLEIAGLVYSSEYQYYSNDNDLWPDYNNVGFAFCSYKSLPIKDYIINYISQSDKTVDELVDEFSQDSEEIKENADLIKAFDKETIISMLEESDEEEFIEMIPYTQIIIKTDTDASSLSDKIDQALKDNYAVYTTRAEMSGIAMLDSEMTQHRMMGAIFPIVFLLIAVLAIITSMNRLVNTQRTQIGTLKALGFSNTKITLHYMLYGLIPSLAGSVLGLVVGPLTLPYLFYDSMSSYFSLPEWKTGVDSSFFVVAILTTLACTIVTYFAVATLLKEQPATTLRPKAPKKFKLTAIEKSSLWKKANFSVKWSFRTFTRGKIRTIMGIVGTVGCMALLVCAFSMYDSMADMESWTYEEIQVQQTRLVLSDTADIEDAEKIADDIDGEIIMTDSVEIRTSEGKKTSNLTVTDGSGCFYLTDENRNQITPDDNTVAITRKVAQSLGINEGDEFEWHIYTSDTWVTSKVTIITRSPMTQGIVITRSTLESLGYEFTPTYVDTLQIVESYDSDSVNRILSEDDMYSLWDNYMQTMNLIVGILILFAIVLAVVVLYNLGQISFTENERENATLKVIGFSNGKILSYNIIQNIIYSLFALILGTPIGLGIVYQMMATSGDDLDIMTKLSPLSLIVSYLITLGVCVLTSLLFAKVTRKLDMVTSLKGVE